MDTVIGITMLVTKEERYDEKRDAISRDWYNYIAQSLPKAILALLPNQEAKTIRLVKRLSIKMLILSGGNDIGSSLARDKTERLLIAYCLRNHIPILGICRGMQLLNLFFNGKLNKDISNGSKEKHVKINHRVNLGSVFSNLAGKDRISVNSFHNHGVMKKDLSQDLEIFAQTDNGVVEGFIHKTKPVLGIQWHPERKNPAKSFDSKLIRKFFHKACFW